jgi:hypothetical protein
VVISGLLGPTSVVAIGFAPLVSNSKAEKILVAALRKVGWKKLPDRTLSGGELDIVIGPKRPLRKSKEQQEGVAHVIR